MNRPGWTKAAVGCHWSYKGNFDWSISTTSGPEGNGYVVVRCYMREGIFPTFDGAAAYVSAEEGKTHMLQSYRRIIERYR